MPHRVVASEERTLLVDMARTQESIFAVDAACRIVYLNEQAEALLGYRASEVLGCHGCDALHLGDAPGSRPGSRPGAGASSRPGAGPGAGAGAGPGPLCSGVLGTSASPPSSSRFVVVATTPAGAHLWLRVLALPAYNAAGHLRIVHVLRAITPEEVAHDAAHDAAHDDVAAPLADLAGVACPPADEEVRRAERTAERTAERQRLPAPPPPPPHFPLTRREREVLKLLAGGLSTANIAAVLSISPVTARNHVTSIIEKLGAKTRLQAVVLASRMGLLLDGKL